MVEANSEGRPGSWRLSDLGGGVALLEMDLAGRPLNVLTSAALAELEKTLLAVAGDGGVKALIVANGKAGTGTFIAGADISEIHAVTDPAEASRLAARGQEILGQLHLMPKITIAAIDGACLGGGCELALACDLRIAADDPKVQIGLPEVLLGIIPGFGGTQRLPRLIGIQPALDLILTGKRLDARKAASLGLVDRIAAPSLLREAAIAFARDAMREKKGWRPARRRKLSQRLALLAGEGSSVGRALLKKFALRAVEKKSGGRYPAPPRAVEAVIDGFPRRLEDGLRLEATLVGPLIVSETAKHLIHIFQASEELRRGAAQPGSTSGDGNAPAVARPKESIPQRRIVVAGAGVMGGGIAALLARKSIRVRLKDIRLEAITTALSHAWGLFSESVARRRMTPAEREAAYSSISGSTTFDGAGSAEMVIEAVVENLEIKKQVLREVEPLLRPDAIFASNTSSLSITSLQEAATDPARVVGLHFFNPVHRMPLVEVIFGRHTSESTIRAAERLSREIGKYPLRVKDGPGFLVNRVLMPYLNEAAWLFSRGAPLVALDRSMKRFGFPMGPFELLDEVGLDVAAKVAHILHAAFGDRAHPAPVLEQITAERRLLGKKGGSGFYIHGGGKLEPNPAVTKLQGTSGDPIPESEWEKRMLYPMVNEAARCLEEEIIRFPREVDIGCVMGIAFPPWRGGILRYADKEGVRAVCDGLVSFADREKDPQRAERYRPAALLKRLAESGGAFQQFTRDGVHEPSVSAAAR